MSPNNPPALQESVDPTTQEVDEPTTDPDLQQHFPSTSTLQESDQMDSSSIAVQLEPSMYQFVSLGQNCITDGSIVMDEAETSAIAALAASKRSSRSYNLTLRQQPKHSRMCGFGEKVDRRPVDPPPIIVKSFF